MTGSVPSLAAGLAFGGISALGAYQTSSNPRNVWVMLGKSKSTDANGELIIYLSQPNLLGLPHFLVTLRTSGKSDATVRLLAKQP